MHGPHDGKGETQGPESWRRRHYGNGCRRAEREPGARGGIGGAKRKVLGVEWNSSGWAAREGNFCGEKMQLLGSIDELRKKTEESWEEIQRKKNSSRNVTRTCLRGEIMCSVWRELGALLYCVVSCK